jgi:hypothetical protein
MLQATQKIKMGIEKRPIQSKQSGRKGINAVKWLKTIKIVPNIFKVVVFINFFLKCLLPKIYN